MTLRVLEVNKCVQSEVHLLTALAYSCWDLGVVFVGARVPQWVASAQLA